MTFGHGESALSDSVLVCTLGDITMIQHDMVVCCPVGAVYCIRLVTFGVALSLV